MKIEYSPAAQLALDKAVLLAHRDGAREIVPMDLLHGLMDEEEGYPVVDAQAAGACLDKLRGLFPAIDNSGRVPGALPYLGPRPRKPILTNARDLARLYAAEGSVSSEHLLLALVEMDASARSSLESIGLDFASLKKSGLHQPEPPLHLRKHPWI